ncbi:MAG: hypothetical protein AABY32_05085 [Nanoarchaeota archaeon]
MKKVCIRCGKNTKRKKTYYFYNLCKKCSVQLDLLINLYGKQSAKLVMEDFILGKISICDLLLFCKNNSIPFNYILS